MGWRKRQEKGESVSIDIAALMTQQHSSVGDYHCRYSSAIATAECRTQLMANLAGLHCGELVVAH